MPLEERERERERERWSLLRAARDEADRSLSLAASLADKETALSHAHATIKEVSSPDSWNPALVSLSLSLSGPFNNFEIDGLAIPSSQQFREQFLPSAESISVMGEPRFKNNVKF